MTEALLANAEPPPEFLKAMHAICDRAKSKKCKLWIDAEQQVLQTAIDHWAVDLMRRYNRDGQVVVYNTIQAYLKASRTKLEHQLALAGREGWTLAVKLVRGAYISSDPRERIHNTKSDTDDSYSSIVRDMLQGTNLGFPKHQFPPVRLFIASHNPQTVSMAVELISNLSKQGQLKTLPDFGQLQGMATELGCELLAKCEEMAISQEPGASKAVPKVYKCLTWGSVQECVQYLLRRMIENSGGSQRLRDGMSAYSNELKRRVSRAVFPFR